MKDLTVTVKYTDATQPSGFGFRLIGIPHAEWWAAPLGNELAFLSAREGVEVVSWLLGDYMPRKEVA